MIGADKNLNIKLENAISQDEGSVINECWSIISTGMDELLPKFFSQIDDDLFSLSEKAETNAKQTQLFEVMRLIRREREGIQTQYMQSLSQAFNDYWKKSTGNLRLVDRKGNRDEDELTLIDEDVLEETLAVNGMTEKGNTLHHAQIYPLTERFCYLSRRETKDESLPMSPEVLCKQFSAILKPIDIELKVKLLIYKMFDRQIVCKLDGIYQNLNAHLSTNGILPSISHKLSKNPRQQADDTGLSAQQPNPYQAAELTAYLETFRTMQSLVDDWRHQLGIKSFSSAAAPGQPVADSEQVISAISRLQQPPEEASLSGSPLSAESLKQRLAQQLGDAQGNHPGKAMGRPEEDIIDMVGLMFDYILDDKNIPSPIKCLIVRLQIPIIKVAILDKTFFARKTHASRILLNDLAQAGVGLSDEDLSADNPIRQKVEEIVNKILNAFNRDVGLFDELLSDFSAFMEKESKRSMLAESRTLQTSQSKEKVWLSKKAVALEISSRLQNTDTPAAFRTFIYNDWKDVMFLAYLRRDKNPEEWKRSLETLDKLVWSLTPPANTQERANLIREIPLIMRAIRNGLESTSLDAHQIDSTLKDLQVCHISTLHSRVSTKHSEASGKLKRDAEAILPTNDVTIKDAELAEVILEIKSHLPDIHNIDIEEVTMGGENAAEKKAAPSWLRDFAQDEHTDAANRLKVGDWIEFINEDGHLWRAKLAWQSPATSLCVFVNRRGVKILELRLNDLAVRMRQGRANAMEAASVPLMDRAVSFLTKSLQNPFAKPAQAPNFA